MGGGPRITPKCLPPKQGVLEKLRWRYATASREHQRKLLDQAQESLFALRHSPGSRNRLETQPQIREKGRVNAAQTWSAVVRWGRTRYE